MAPPEKRAQLHLVASAPAPDGDEALAAGVVQRHPGAARALWDRYGGLVHALVRRALGPDHDVEDTVQETFIRVYGGIGQLRDRAALRSFIVAVTMNLVRVELRRRRLRRWMRLTDSGVVPEVSTGPVAGARVAVVRFYAILDQLGAQERACYVLRALQQLELTEVAEALGLSLATVKRRLTRAEERIARRVTRDPFLRDYLYGPRDG